MSMVRVGLERWMEPEARRPYRKARVGLFTHLAAVDGDLASSVDRVAAMEDMKLRAIFAPEHGLYGVVQAGGVIGDEVHPRHAVPMYSLYGWRSKPSPEMMADLDLLLIDVQDLGVRFYTYISTMGYLLEAAGEHGVKVIVLDRPNPLGGRRAAGPIVRPENISYVGRFPIPLRYGLTIGELAIWLCRHYRWSVDLDVLPCEGWERSMWWEDTGRIWVPTSPNIPTPETTIVYPGFALLEGTNLSEGRGTTKPFEWFGAPWLLTQPMIDRFHRLDLPGVKLRETYFTPTFSKYEGRLCRGAQVHVTDRDAFDPLLAAVALLRILKELHPEELQWTDPVNERIFIDLLTGTDELRTGAVTDDAYKKWEAEAQAFQRAAAACFLYS